MHFQEFAKTGSGVDLRGVELLVTENRLQVTQVRSCFTVVVNVRWSYRLCRCLLCAWKASGAALSDFRITEDDGHVAAVRSALSASIE